MQFVAKSNRLPFSPFKMRPLVDVVRGQTAEKALGWLKTYPVKRVVPIKKMIESAVANAKNKGGVEISELFIKEIRVDQGRIVRYSKPGAMGRAALQRRRFCHMSVVLEQKTASEKV